MFKIGFETEKKKKTFCFWPEGPILPPLSFSLGLGPSRGLSLPFPSSRRGPDQSKRPRPAETPAPSLPSLCLDDERALHFLSLTRRPHRRCSSSFHRRERAGLHRAKAKSSSPEISLPNRLYEPLFSLWWTPYDSPFHPLAFAVGLAAPRHRLDLTDELHKPLPWHDFSTRFRPERTL